MEVQSTLTVYQKQYLSIYATFCEDYLLMHGSMAKLRGNQAYRFNGDDTRYFYGQ